MQEIHLNIFENHSGQSNKDFFEGKVNSLLNKTLNETAREMRIDLEEVGLAWGETFIEGREHISLKSLKELYFSGLNELLYWKI